MLAAIHFVADFMCQTHNQAIKKSSSLKHLTAHCLIYGAVFFVSIMALMFVVSGWAGVSYFAFKFFRVCCYTAFFHWITDYFTSRINAWLWKRGNMHNFFVGVGADQLVHIATLVLTFEYLF